MPPVPRKEALELVTNYLKRFSKEPDVEMFARNDMPGTAYEMAQLKRSPGALNFEERTPHIVDLETGEWTSGEPGQFHNDLIKQQLIGKQFSAKNKAFIGEFPGEVSWDMEGRENLMSETQKTRAVELMQQKFPTKPVVSGGKVFGATAATGAGLAAASEAQASEDPFLAQVRASAEPEPITDPFLAEIAQTAEVTEAAAQDVNKGLPPSIAEQFAMGPLEIAKRLYPKATVPAIVGGTKDFLQEVIEADIETIKTGGKEGFFPTDEMIAFSGEKKEITPNPVAQTGIRAANVSLALGDAALAGFVIKSLKAFPKAVKTLFKPRVPTSVTPETVAKEAVAAKAISAEGQVDPTVGTMDQLEFEWNKYHNPGTNISPLLKQKDISRASLLAGQGNRRYNEDYISFKPAGQATIKENIKKTTTELAKDKAIAEKSALREDAARTADRQSQGDMFADQEFQTVKTQASELNEIAGLTKNIETVPVTSTSLLRGIQRNAFLSTVVALRKAGPVGEDIAKRFIRFMDVPEQQTANAIQDFRAGWIKLSRTEQDNLIDLRLYEHLSKHPNPSAKIVAKPVKELNAKVAAVRKLIQHRTGEATDMARTVGGNVVNETREFWPQHLITPQGFENNKKFADYLVRTGQYPNKIAAKNAMQSYGKKYGEHKFAGLETERTFFVGSAKELRKFGFDTDLSAIETYLLGANRRIQSLIEFGPKGRQTFDELYKTLSIQDPQAAEIALDTFDRITHRNRYNEIAMKLIQAGTTYSIWRHMGLSGIMQLLSHPSIFIRAGFKNGMIGTWKGIKSLNKNTKEFDFASRSGAIINNIMKDVHAGYASGASDWYLKYNGTNFFDNFTRLMAVHTGKEMVKDMTVKLLRNPNNKYWNRVAKELDIDVKSLLANKGLDTDQLYIATKRFSDTTIGRTRAIDMPALLGSPYVGMQTLFKKFAVFYTGFMWRHLYKEVLQHGNLRPLLPAIVVGLPYGEMIGNLRATAKDKQRPAGSWHQIAKQIQSGKIPNNIGDRLMDDLLVIQMFGIFGDLVLGASYGMHKGVQRLEETFLGAPATDTIKLVTAVINGTAQVAKGETTKRNLKPIYKEAIKHIETIPFGVGAWLSQWAQEQVYPEDRKRQQIWRR